MRIVEVGPAPRGALLHSALPEAGGGGSQRPRKSETPAARRVEMPQEPNVSNNCTASNPNPNAVTTVCTFCECTSFRLKAV